MAACFVTDFREMKFRWLLLMATGMGLGILTKGPIAFLMPMSIVGMFLLLLRQEQFYSLRWQGTSKLLGLIKPFHPTHFVRTTLAIRPFTLALISIGIALPWYAWVGVRTEGDFLRIFFLTEHLGRSTVAFENHSGGVWFYPIAILFGFFPWSLLWLPVALILWRLAKNVTGLKRSFLHDHAGIVLMLCWIAVQVSLFTLVQTKLPSYVTPCYPALAILTAACIVKWKRNPALLPRGWMSAVFVVALIVGVIISVGMGVAGQRFIERPALCVVGVPIVAAGVAGLMLIRKDHRKSSIASFAICAVVFSLALFGYAAGQIAGMQDNQKILSRLRELPADIKPASFKCLESSWVYYAARPIYELDNTVSESGRNPDRRFWQPKPRLSVRQFATNNPDAPIITTAESLAELELELPARYEVVAEADYFLKNKKLLLLQRPR
jgi:4-amino-4-deoxy-L-arabinose transferase-like glycosyltransferase